MQLKATTEWLANKGSVIVFPLCLVFSKLLELVLYYAGMGYQANSARDYAFIACSILFALFVGIVWLAVLYEKKVSWQSAAVASSGVGLILLCFLLSYIRFGLTDVLTSYVSMFIVFALPCFFAGFCGAVQNDEQSFFPVLEKASFLALPAAIIYLIGQVFHTFPHEWNYGTSLGILHYMTVAYAFMPFLLAHLIEFTKGSTFCFPFGQAIKKPQLVRGIFILVYWISMIATGTRGAYVCVPFVCLVLFVKHRGFRLKKTWRQNYMPVLLVCVLAFNIYVYAPPGFSRVHRMDIFLDGVRQGEFVTSYGNKTPGGETDDFSGNYQAASEDAINQLMTDPNSPELAYLLKNRGTMYRLALKELQQSPIWGMGPLGYSIKYGTYPHNAVLELLCETGIIGTAIAFGVLLWLLIKLIKREKQDKEAGYILILLSAFAVLTNISGSIWTCSALFWALGYGLPILPSARPIRA